MQKAQMMKLEDYLQLHATQSPAKVAVCSGTQCITYGELWQQVQHKAAQMQCRGCIVPFRATQDAGFLITYFAIHLAGGVAMPLEADLPDSRLDELRRFADAEASHLPAEAADVLFTTGTTGRSKGVVVSHRAIIADAENLIGAQHYHPDLNFLIAGPLNHIGSLSKVYPVVVTGGSLTILSGMKDLNAFFDAIDRAEGTVGTFLVPASVRMLLAFASKRLPEYRDKIELIETGAAPIMPSDARRLREALPRTRLYNTYASTETGIIATHNFNDGNPDNCDASCVGRAMRHSSVTITPDGRVACHGATLMSGYLGDPDLTASVLTGDTLITADLGMLDSEHRLHLKGRADDIINVGGYKIDPVEVESAAAALPMVAECMCMASEHPVIGTVLKLLVVPAAGAAFSPREIAMALKKQLPAHKIPSQYAQVDAIPRTYNGKPMRRAANNILKK